MKSATSALVRLEQRCKDAARRRLPQRKVVETRLREALSVLRGRRGPDERTDEEFVEDAYRLVLQRPVDPSGRRTWLAALREGVTRDQVVLRLALSEESINRHLAAKYVIQNLRELRPEKYREIPTTDGARMAKVFEAASAEDFDWLEHAILQYGYYEKPGIWTFGVNDDKRRMADLLSLFAPQRALEIGCSSGALLGCLRALGVDAEGVDISAMAARRADPAVRPHIHVGDVLATDLPGPYDLVYGLDVFEHFNPNRLHDYIERAAALLRPGGFLYVNVPAFGDDRVYGTIWSLYLQSWQEDAAAGRMFHQLEVDADGYPLLGHLVWAASPWWEERFTETGLQREVGVERALHARFDAAMDATPARKAFYVFSKEVAPDAVEGLMQRISA